jgi:hypothetical protein
MLCQLSMADTNFPQYTKKTSQNQTRSEFLLRPLYGVRQDRSAPQRERAGSAQPYTVGKATVYTPLDKNSDRVKKQPTRAKSVPITARIEKPVKLEIDRIAKESGKTRSQTIATLLDEAVHRKLHLNHAVMLAPLIREAVIRAFQPLLPLLLSIAYDASQTRYLTGNLLAKQVRPEELDSIREKTAKKAKHTILHKCPHIAGLVELVKASLPLFSEAEEPA